MKQFQRNIEDFTCEHCGVEVKGNGYTNHCPKCLWSKHVDINPGDREAICKGLMEPVAVERSGDGYILTHKCVLCGYQKRNKTSGDDSSDALVTLAKSLAL